MYESKNSDYCSPSTVGLKGNKNITQAAINKSSSTKGRNKDQNTQCGSNTRGVCQRLLGSPKYRLEHHDHLCLRLVPHGGADVDEGRRVFAQLVRGRLQVVPTPLLVLGGFQPFAEGLQGKRTIHLSVNHRRLLYYQVLVSVAMSL